MYPGKLHWLIDGAKQKVGFGPTVADGVPAGFCRGGDVVECRDTAAHGKCSTGDLTNQCQTQTHTHTPVHSTPAF